MASAHAVVEPVGDHRAVIGCGQHEGKLASDIAHENLLGGNAIRRCIIRITDKLNAWRYFRHGRSRRFQEEPLVVQRVFLRIHPGSDPVTTAPVSGRRPGAVSRAAAGVNDSILAVGRILMALICVTSGIEKLLDPGATPSAIGSKGLTYPNILAVLTAILEAGGG